MAVAFFDLDRTLIDCNSGRLWVQFEWRNGRMSNRDVLWASWWLGRYSLGIDDGLEAVFETAVRTLEGIEESVLANRIARWFDDEVGHRLRPGAADVLDQHRHAGDRLVIATSSSPYAARRACEVFGLHEAIATTFEVRGGKFTGLVEDLAVGPAKLDRAAEWALRNEVDLGETTFYTDSVSDRALMEAVGRPVAVNPDRALRKLAAQRGWEIVDWGRTR